MPAWGRRVLPRLGLLIGILLLARDLLINRDLRDGDLMDGDVMERPLAGEEHRGSGSNQSGGEPPLILLWNNYQEDRSALYRTIFRRWGRPIVTGRFP
jgi:hypothetical protein